MKLLISIPCLNEQELIKKTIKSLPDKINGFTKISILLQC